MALREKLTERAQPWLEDGEQVEGVFLAQTGPTPYLTGFLGVLGMLAFVKRRIVVVTDRAIVVLKAGSLSGTNAKEVVARLPRQTPIGPTSGLWSKIELGDESMWVNRRFQKDVEAADVRLTQPPA
jgi:hypothetical protein